MDKEAQLLGILEGVWEHNVGPILALRALKELGYRKLPEGKPPLLTTEEREHYFNENRYGGYWDIAEMLEAQRNSDIKWYGEQ